MRSVEGSRFCSVLVPGLCRGAYAQTRCVLDIKDAIGFLTLWLLREAQLYRFQITFAVFATAALERPQLGRREDCER
jgi:hypothetical protein